MPVCCERCKKSFKDNFNLQRHYKKKKPCPVITGSSTPIKPTDTSGVTIINITINQQINNFGTPDNEHIGVRGLKKSVSQFDKNDPMFTTGKALLTYQEQLIKIPENRNAIVDPKSTIGKIFINGNWTPCIKSEIINKTVTQTARNLSDRIDIVGGIDPPEKFISCLELMAYSGLDPSRNDLDFENVNGLTVLQRRYLMNGFTVNLMKP